MSAFEQAYPSLLQGVSQQIPKLRLEGQVSTQLNMLSDIVTNARRRPGAGIAYALDVPGETHETIRIWDTDVSGLRVTLFVGTATGNIWVVDQALTTVLATFTTTYLATPDASKIRGTTIGNSFYFLNTGIKPTAVYTSPPLTPDRRGFFYIKAGAFSKEFSAIVTNNLGGVTISFTTPTGTGAGDAAASTPEAIANSLTTGSNLALLAAVSVTPYRVGAYVYLEGLNTVTSLTVATGSGSTYVQASNASRVRLEGDLPAVLTVQANGYIVAVGDQKLFRYYQYKSTTNEWLECGIYGSPTGITNMPVTLNNTGGSWTLDQGQYEGRLAGDDDTNPLPEFLTRGLSGMGAFQSRLVLLGGSRAYLSSSDVTRRFMRSTVTGLLDSDPIAVGASANSSAEYRYAVPFQKDLLLFSDKYQALIPSSGTAITPRNATVLLTSSYAVDTGAEPIPLGRTLLFPAPRSKDYFGLMEMVSSQYTDAQYVSNDATAHLPKYMDGRCRYAVASSVASLALFGPSNDHNTCIVYEYLWDGDTKVQQAWHKWHFEYPVATAYFSSGIVNVVCVKNNLLIVLAVDPKAGPASQAGNKYPYTDANFFGTVVNNKVTISNVMPTFDPTFGSKAMITIAQGDLAGEEVGIVGYDAGTRTFTTVPSFPDGLVFIGVPYRSEFAPSPPVYKDRLGNKVETNKFTVLRFGLSTANSAAYQIELSDAYTLDPVTFEQGTMYFSSDDLQLGHARNAPQSRAIIPARTEADTTSLLMYTEGAGEMNFTGIDYTGRFNQRIKRRA